MVAACLLGFGIIFASTLIRELDRHEDAIACAEGDPGACGRICLEGNDDGCARLEGRCAEGESGSCAAMEAVTRYRTTGRSRF